MTPGKLPKKDRLIRIIDRLRKVKVLVVGDIILDHYIWGKAQRLSPEAPVPVVWANREEYLLGGASNVAHNSIALGAKAEICGIMGSDFYSDVLKSLLRKKNVSGNLIVVDKNRPTTLKTRVIAQHQQVVRIDWESSEFVSFNINKKMISLIKRNIHKFDLVIIEDYGKGMINPSFLEALVHICRKNKKIVTVDPKEEHFDYYKEVTALTPNLKEAEYATGMRVKKDEDIDILAHIILDKLNPRALLVTLGDKGMRLFLKTGQYFHLPASAIEVFDVSGAGDTVIAVFSLGLASGASFLEAAYLANLAAGIVVGRLGVAVTSPLELKKRVIDHFRGRK